MKRLCLLLTTFTLCLCCRAEHQKQLFDYSASATLTSNYIWRGLYVGGPSLQLDATVSYAGLYANLWWNIGATDWTFHAFNPEVDICIGFTKWGLNINYLHCFYFDHYPDGTPSRFFDFRNHPQGGGGTTGEWRIAYRLSDKIPLSCLVAFRTFGRDGYIHQGQLIRAYSTYIELGYDLQLPNHWLLAARIGATPAKSLYTAYQDNFAITLVGLKLNKTWNFQSMQINAFAHLMLQPWKVNKHNLILPISHAAEQKLNLAVGCSVGI